MSDNSFSVFTLLNNNWVPYGYLSINDCVIFDNSGNACYRFDSGWLVSYRERSIYRVDSDGRIIDIYNHVIGLINNYPKLPEGLNRTIYKEVDHVFIDYISPIFRNSSDELVLDYFQNLSDINHAESIAKTAYFNKQDCPEYIVLYASHLFFVVDSEAGKYGRMCDTDDKTLKLLYDVYNFCNKNLNIEKYSSVINKIRELSYYLIGEYYATHDYMVEAEKILSSVNVDIFPYKSVLMAMVVSYGMSKEYERTGYVSPHWEGQVRDVVNLLKRSLLSNHWFNSKQKSIALTDLQGYLSGIYFNINEVEYSYYCLLFARALQDADVAFIDSELRKYRKTHSGKLIYDIED
ncbi:MAG: hypothetical protein K6F64_09620 [Clostridia bacterium]|nr:hypothetical protein [Clostridia bacterium]